MTTANLDKARERFLVEHELDRSVRPSISTSWRRSKAFNVRADQLDLPYVRDPNLESPLVVAAAPVLRQLAEGLSDEPVSVVLTSADGCVLTRISSSARLNRMLDDVRLAPGYSYSEQYAGTNGIGTTLETREPTLVTGAEHYSESLGGLACAGVPIIHPISGIVVGALDLTGWVQESGGLLATLARTATNQIEGRLLTHASAAQTALLNSYLRACRRCPQNGILALGDDVVLMNDRLRRALNAQDQASLLEHAVDAVESVERRTIADLPSGGTVRLTRTDDARSGLARGAALFQVHLADVIVERGFAAQPGPGAALPGLAGTSSSWRLACAQIVRCVRDRQWVVVDGEPGSGRAAALRAAAESTTPGGVRYFDAADLTNDAVLARLEDDLARDGFTVVVRDVDLLDERTQQALADLLQQRQHTGWIGVTTGAGRDDLALGALLLPLFTRTVSVPALRHRIEDLNELIPRLLRQLTRSDALTLSPAAIRQLGKYSWPGNVEELRQVLREIVQRQRTGVVEVAQLPPSCRSVGRHTLSQMEALERDAIVRSLEQNGANKKAAAESLGLSRATIYRKIKQFGIDL